MVVDANWRRDLEGWLAPFLAGLSHPARRKTCPLHIAGLIGPGDRKSVQPMAARTGEAGYDQLHHYVAAGVWDSTPLEQALLSEADRLVGDQAGFLVIDDTVMPKKGRHSVGVAPQYASSLGKTANCQALVSVTLASREVPVLVGLRLFLPESWTGDAERMQRARVPADRQAALTKPEIAIEEIDRVMAAGALWLRAGRRRLRIERLVPPRLERTWPAVGEAAQGSSRAAGGMASGGGWHVAPPEGLSGRRRHGLSSRQYRQIPQVSHPHYDAGLCRGGAGW